MKRDGRTLDHGTLETIRMMAMERVREGEAPSDVIASYGFHRTTIYIIVPYLFLMNLLFLYLEFYGLRGPSGRVCCVDEPNAKFDGLYDNIKICHKLRTESVSRAWYERLTNTRDERPPAWLFDDVTANLFDNHRRVRAEILLKLNKGAQIGDQAEYERMRSELPAPWSSCKCPS